MRAGGRIVSPRAGVLAMTLNPVNFSHPRTKSNMVKSCLALLLTIGLVAAAPPFGDDASLLENASEGQDCTKEEFAKKVCIQPFSSCALPQMCAGSRCRPPVPYM
jgi:hypothetical protein